jgi:histidinol phosphatase-like PHP family hydrolase
MADLTRQHQEIDALNRRFRRTFRMIKGIEANIRADGSIDMDQRRTEDARTGRGSATLSAADHIRSDRAHDLCGASAERAHPWTSAGPEALDAGRESQSDWGLVFEAAAESGVAIEIDGDPSRQDIDFALAQRAIRAGCLFALDSDAHSSRELEYAETAVAHARLAGIPKARVINTWEVERLLAWAAERGSVKTPRRRGKRRPRV